MKLTTALGIMNLMNHQSNLEVSMMTDVSEMDMALLRQPRPYVGTDRNTVLRVMRSLMTASLDVAGLPPVQLNAEYVAAHVFVYVHPANYLAICVWLGDQVTMDDQILETGEKISARRLFSYICKINDAAEFEGVKAAFEKKINLALGKSEVEKEIENAKKK